MAGMFHVQFGINETNLTKALERREFEKALEFISSGRSSSGLDEGYYQRTPLFIVLSGQPSNEDGKPMPLHLQIARKLIEKGANPNYRVPETCGSEFVSPGKSPLECVVDSYCQLASRQSKASQSRHTALDGIKAVSGQGQTNLTIHQILTELIDLTWLLLGHGADLNIRDSENKTPLHTAILKSNNLHLTQVLCDNVLVESVDCFGNTPLMSLCSPLPFKHSSSLGPCVTDKNAMLQTLTFLLGQQVVNVNRVNSKSRSALFMALQSGNIPAAKILLDNGADVTIPASGPEGGHMSGLFAALIPWLEQGQSQQERLAQITSLVDAGYFNHQGIVDEIIDFIPQFDLGVEMLWIHSSKPTIVQQIFGQSSASLASLSARAVLETKYQKDTSIHELTCVDLRLLIQENMLPQNLLHNFQLALLRYLILYQLRQTDWDLDEFELPDSDAMDESDEEYW